MDGLSVVFRADGAPAEARTLRLMTAAGSHRGVVSASWADGPLALAHLRAPGESKDAHVAVARDAGLAAVLSGRLHNRDEVARALRAHGEELVGPEDVVLLLGAYRRWGERCVEHLDGEFAFVLYDEAEHLVLCARDPLGVRPLYYAFNRYRLLVASEPKQLLAAGVSAEPHGETIAGYLAGAEFLADGPRTFLREVMCLEPGHRLCLRRRVLSVDRYWQLDPERTVEERGEAMAEHVRALLESAVARRLPAGPPYACVLGHDLDSASVALLLRRVLDTRGIEDALDVVARQHGPGTGADDSFVALADVLRAADAPTGSTGDLDVWRTQARAAAEGVSVLLADAGGEELFCGRPLHLADLLRGGRLVELGQEVWGLHQSNGHDPLGSILTACALGPLVPPRLTEIVRRVVQGAEVTPPWIQPVLARRTELADRLRVGPTRTYADVYRQDCWERLHYGVVRGALPTHEALAAAHGIELRFPLLDRRLVEYLFAVPREHKRLGGETRLLQRRALADLLPETGWQNGNGHEPSLLPCARLVAEVDRLLARPFPVSADYIDWRGLRPLEEPFRQGDPLATLVLWRCLNLERWLEGLLRVRARTAA